MDASGPEHRRSRAHSQEWPLTNQMPCFCRSEERREFSGKMKTKKLGGRSASRLANGSPSCGFVCLEHLQEAELIQSSLLPAGPLQDPSIDIDFRFTPFWEVGGDFTDFFRLPNGMIGLYLGDVVGKGLPATLYSALVMGTLRGAHKTVFDPASRTLTFSKQDYPYLFW